MSTITANELKTKGVSIIKEALENDEEAAITVRGKNTYVVINIARYNELREHELYNALQEVRADYQAGNFTTETAEEHVRSITECQD